jgi:hypothetical protein
MGAKMLEEAGPKKNCFFNRKWEVVNVERSREKTQWRTVFSASATNPFSHSFGVAPSGPAHQA